MASLTDTSPRDNKERSKYDEGEAIQSGSLPHGAAGLSIYLTSRLTTSVILGQSVGPGFFPFVICKESGGSQAAHLRSNYQEQLFK